MAKGKIRQVKVGCCGFGGAMSTYIEQFDTVEIQHTFYQPPQLATLHKWRAAVPGDFEFTLKAWQLITHEAKSPTYRRLKRELTEQESTECGAFKNTAIVKEAWQTTLECAKALQARRILFQCPASFKPTAENLKNLRKFFSKINRDYEYYFEPRGKDWTPELVKELCDTLDIGHAVDPFVSQCQTPDRAYFRLHGKSGWRYVYTDDEIEQIAKSLPKSGVSYVMFNNIKMREDAQRFLGIL
jgi:uncharacterized protein YecE (DUF72 family)